VRIKAIRTLAKNPRRPSRWMRRSMCWRQLISATKLDGDLANVLDESIRDSKFAGQIAISRSWPGIGFSRQRELAYSILVSLANSRLSKGDAKANAARAVDQAWAKPRARRVCCGRSAGRSRRISADGRGPNQ